MKECYILCSCWYIYLEGFQGILTFLPKLNLSILVSTGFLYFFFNIECLCNQMNKPTQTEYGEHMNGYIKILTVNLCVVNQNKITY